MRCRAPSNARQFRWRCFLLSQTTAVALGAVPPSTEGATSRRGLLRSEGPILAPDAFDGFESSGTRHHFADHSRYNNATAEVLLEVSGKSYAFKSGSRVASWARAVGYHDAEQQRPFWEYAFKRGTEQLKIDSITGLPIIVKVTGFCANCTVQDQENQRGPCGWNASSGEYSPHRRSDWDLNPEKTAWRFSGGTAGECKMFCADLDGCTAFSFFPGSGECYPYKERCGKHLDDSGAEYWEVAEHIMIPDAGHRKSCNAACHICESFAGAGCDDCHAAKCEDTSDEWCWGCQHYATLLQPQANHCAYQNDNCKCTGTVWYGKRFDAHNVQTNSVAKLKTLGNYRYKNSWTNIACNKGPTGLNMMDDVLDYEAICFCEEVHFPDECEDKIDLATDKQCQNIDGMAAFLKTQSGDEHGLDTKEKCYQACAWNPLCTGFGWRAHQTQSAEEYCHLVGEDCDFQNYDEGHGIEWYNLNRSCLTAPQSVHIVEDMVKLQPPANVGPPYSFAVQPLDDDTDAMSLVPKDGTKLKDNVVLRMLLWCEHLDACLTKVEYCSEHEAKGIIVPITFGKDMIIDPDKFTAKAWHPISVKIDNTHYRNVGHIPWSNMDRVVFTVAKPASEGEVWVEKVALSLSSTYSGAHRRFTMGTEGSNYCPIGYKLISAQTLCIQAMNILNLGPWRNQGHWYNRPKMCYYSSGGADHTGGYFNGHDRGHGLAGYWPICAMTQPALKCGSESLQCERTPVGVPEIVTPAVTTSYAPLGKGREKKLFWELRTATCLGIPGQPLSQINTDVLISGTVDECKRSCEQHKYCRSLLYSRPDQMCYYQYYACREGRPEPTDAPCEKDKCSFNYAPDFQANSRFMLDCETVKSYHSRCANQSDFNNGLFKENYEGVNTFYDCYDACASTEWCVEFGYDEATTRCDMAAMPCDTLENPSWQMNWYQLNRPCAYGEVTQRWQYVKDLEAGGFIGIFAHQSSTVGMGKAYRAVDGNLAQNDADGESCTLTENQANPWWKVELPKAEHIYSVRIAARSDAHPERLDPFFVHIDSQPCIMPSAGIPMKQGGVEVIHCNHIGRDITIFLNKTEQLAICEVEVLLSVPL